MIQEGDIILLEPGHTVYTMLPKHLVYSNCEGEWDSMAKAAVRIGDEWKFDSDYLAGEYIVTKTASDGGGPCYDFYPDGHHIFASKADNPRIKVDFYQSGGFTAVNRDVKVVGKAEMTWTRKKGKS
jgi:hypothetical protein